MKYTKWKQCFSLITCILIMAAVAISKDQKILGKDLLTSSSESKEKVVEEFRDDNTLVIYTEDLAKDVVGFGGNTPLKIHLKDGVITQIVILKNAETPDFLQKVEETIIPQWIGKTVDEALNNKVDAVSGATLSSNAVSESIRKGLFYAQGADNCNISAFSTFISSIDLKFILTLTVVLLGALVPLFIRSRRYRIVQLILNVVILGFWSGSFISYSLMVNYMSNGMKWTMIIPIVMLIVAFVYPLLGKKGHYCAWVCPLGSAQELLSKSSKFKIKIKPEVMKYLNYFRNGLWACLMLLMWAGVCFEWMDYELFTAFIFQQASIVVLVLAVIFLLLSLFVQRPYCRFFCPTGTLFNISQNVK